MGVPPYHRSQPVQSIVANSLRQKCGGALTLVDTLRRSAAPRPGIGHAVARNADMRPPLADPIHSRIVGSRPHTGKRQPWSVSQDLRTAVCWTFRNVGDPEAGHEAQPFVESVHPWVRSTTLHKHMMAIVLPCVRECGLNYGAAVPATA